MDASLQLPFYRRFLQYLRERFPLPAHGALIAALVWAMAGSGASWGVLALGWMVLTCFFLQVRIIDEHKDAAIDAAYRRELPVPRGLISLRELRTVAWVLLAVQLLIQAWLLPRQLPYFVAIAAFLALMGREFFIGAWLRRHFLVYAASHMLLLPLVAWYAASLAQASTWDGASLAQAGAWAYVAIYFAGFTLEIGRKLRAPADERPGVETYSATFGPARAALLWFGCVVAASVGCALALMQADASAFSIALNLLPPVLAMVLLVRFRRNPQSATARYIDKASGLFMLLQLILLGLSKTSYF